MYHPGATTYLAMMLLTLLVLSGCAQRDVPGAGSTELDTDADARTGITVFGDARLGVAFD